MPPPAPSTIEIKSPPDKDRSYRGTGKRHEGVDIRAAEGTPVQAVGDGRVYYVYDKWKPGDGQAAGNFIIIDHPNGIRSEYMHLSEISVRRGDTVGGGTLIGKTGRTGGKRALDADADPMVPHLHFGISTNESGRFERVNPTKFVKIQESPDSGLMGRLKAWLSGRGEAGPEHNKATVDPDALEALERGRALGKRLQQESAERLLRQRQEWDRRREQQRQQDQIRQQERWRQQREDRERQRQLQQQQQHGREENLRQQEERRRQQALQREEQQRREAQAREARERDARLRDQQRREQLERQNRQARVRPFFTSPFGAPGGRPIRFTDPKPVKPMQWRFTDIPGRDTVTVRPGVTRVDFGGGTAIVHF